MNELKMPWDEYKIRYAMYALTPRIVALKAFRDWLCDQPDAIPLAVRFDSIEGHLQLLCVERVEEAVRFGAEQSREEIARLKAANRQLEQELSDLRSREMDADDIASYVELVKELRDKLEEARKELARRNSTSY